MAELTEWLRLMLAEIARKREDGQQAATEQALRAIESPPARQAGAPEPTVVK